ncbi:MAG: NDP-sugar synthase [Vicinamibacterales bacterium]
MKRPPVMVLAAGLGTRLRPLTYARAKAAVPVNGEPLARRVARWLGASQFCDLVFNLHHHPESIAACLGDGADLGVRVRYSWEQPILGSGGGPRHALPLLTDGGSERFLMVNGDTLTNVDLDALIRAHVDSGALVTMALIRNPAPEKYGGVQVNEDGFVTGFSRRGAAPESFHFIGVQVAEARTFLELEDGVQAESVMGLYPRLIARDSRAVGAFVSDASFRDIGSPADCLRTTLDLAAIEGPHLAGSGTRIHPSAVVDRSALWDDVTVGAMARLTECIVADGVTIHDGAVFERSAIVGGADGLLIQPL